MSGFVSACNQDLCCVGDSCCGGGEKGTVCATSAICEGCPDNIGCSPHPDCPPDSDPSTTCFPAGTEVRMSDSGRVPIEDIEVGDTVLSYNLSSGKYMNSTVQELESPVRDAYFNLKFSDGEGLNITNEHPIYASKGDGYEGWVSIEPEITEKDSGMEVKKIEEGNKVLTLNGEWKELKSIKKVEGEIQTYNLKSVSGTNTFFAEDVLVHNKDTSCFPAGSEVNTSKNKEVPIEDIEVGDTVLSYNLSSGKYVNSTVQKLETPVREAYYKLSFRGGALNLTDEHPIYTFKENGYAGWASLNPSKTLTDSGMFVKRIEKGDSVFTGEGLREIQSIRKVKGEIQTYNLKSVSGTNTFFAEDVLVHNKGECTPDCAYSGACDESAPDGCGDTCTRDTDGNTCTSDGDSCTTDVCSGSSCTHEDICDPVTSIDPNGHDWTNENVDFTLSCNDQGPSGCDVTQYSIASEGESCSLDYTGTSGTVSCPNDQSCKKYVCYRSIDNEGNDEDKKTSNLFKIDKVNPGPDPDDEPGTTIDPYKHDWTNKSVDYTLTCSDSDSGCDKINYFVYNISDMSSCPSKSSSEYNVQTVSGNTASIIRNIDCMDDKSCQKRVCFYSEDVAGNVEPVNNSGLFKIDKVDPSTLPKEEPNTIIEPYNHSWINKDVEFNITCHDSDSGCAKVFYNVTSEGSSHSTFLFEDVNGKTAKMSKNVTCPDGKVCGSMKVFFYSQDVAGNTEPENESGLFKIDKVPPVVECDDCWEQKESSVTFDPEVTDIGSGVDNMKVCLDKNCKEVLCSSSAPYTNCTYSYDKCIIRDNEFWFQGEDVAGNKDLLKGGNFELKAGKGCTCSYDNECLSGICIGGRCLETMPPEIYFD